MPGVTVQYQFAPFGVVVCRGCGLKFLSPRLAEVEALKLYQAESYFQAGEVGPGYDDYREARANWLKTFAVRLKPIRALQPPGRALDVGCGPGYFMEAAARQGYEVWGVDVSAYGVRLAREKFGERVLAGTLEQAAFAPQSFDLISAFDTFEHLYAPLSFLAQAGELLRPGGLLVITTPNARSWLARVSGRRWVSFKIPEHVFFWSPSPMIRALQDRYRIVAIESAGQYTSVGFLVRRLLGLRGLAASRMPAVVKGLGRINVWTDNGSMTVMAERR
jgi:SAM-dependent methyltransferase